MIQGETGTGKELVARAIHFNSLRKEKPFLALNCAGIPENLLETELFGYERGAFTGAERQKPGKFELAHEGTLFLDEISSLRMDVQAKILRALQEGEIERVGGTKTLKIDARVLSATNVDLPKAVREGKFREDLYYRLHVVPIFLAPLRERREDVPLLFQHFLEMYGQKSGKRVRGVTQKALEYLTHYRWPGNIRELENMVERLVVLAEKEVIDTTDLPFDVFLQAGRTIDELMQKSILLRDARNLFEKQFITAVLKRTRWNQSQAARTLGIHRNTLLMKAEQLGIEKVGPDES
jgi:two-component system response regulator AtoC